MPLSAFWHLLRDNRNVRLLWSAQVVSEMGDWFYSVAIFSFLLELTGSAQMVAFAFLMQVLPQVFMSPTAGVINDRISRKKVMIFADVMRAGIVLAMLLVRSSGTLWLLFVLLALETGCYALFEPGRSATIPNIAQPEQIPVANALSSATWSVVFAAGAALGGLVDVAFGRETVFVLDSLSFIASAIFIRRMHFAEPHAQGRPRLSIRELFDFTPVAEGMRYVTRDRKLLAVLLVKGGVGVMGTNWVILPVLGQKLFPVRLAGLTARQAGTLWIDRAVRLSLLGRHYRRGPGRKLRGRESPPPVLDHPGIVPDERSRLCCAGPRWIAGICRRYRRLLTHRRFGGLDGLHDIAPTNDGRPIPWARFLG